MGEQAIRLKLFDWLNEQSLLNNHVFPRQQLATGFTIEGKVISLVGPSGIWIPAGFSMPISITTTAENPYKDGPSEDGELIYKYRRGNPNHRENDGLRMLMKQTIPLVYFQSIKPGKYFAYWPIFIREDIRSKQAVRVELNPVYMMYGIENSENISEKDKLGIMVPEF